MLNVGSTEKLVVVGPSMGGLITRYALAYLEKNNINTNTKLWVSMDSPHQGANIPLAIQEDIYFFGRKLKQEDANNKFDKLLHSKAAEQMLIDIVDYSGWPVKNQNNENFLSQLKSNGVSNSNGFPILNGIKKIAISNGSLSGIKNVEPKQNFLDIAASAKIRLLGIRIGRKRIFRVNNYYMPNFGDSTVLIDNQGRNPDANVDNTTLKVIINAGWNANGSMDAVPGGNTNSANDLKNEVNASLLGTNAFSFPLSLGKFFILPILTTDKNLIINNYIPSDPNTIINPQSFIPTHSSLDTKNFIDWYQPINKNIVCSSQTPFDSFYGESFNMEHISFSNDMVNWLMNNLKFGLQFPHFPIDAANFSGANIICLNATSAYSFSDICKLPSTPIWSLSPNLQLVSSSATGITVMGVAGGQGVITATFSNGQVFTKKIWIGAPINSISNSTNCPSTSAPCSLGGTANNNYLSYTITANDIASYTPENADVQWEKIQGNFYFQYSGQYNSNTTTGQTANIYLTGANPTDKPLMFRSRVQNTCGWGDWRTYTWNDGTTTPVTPPTPPANYYTLAPNPAQYQTYVVIKDSNLLPPIPAFSAELYNPISGQMISKVYFENGQALFSSAIIGYLIAGNPYFVKVLYPNGSYETITLMKQ